MILVKLFLTFLKIGALSFGGGYAMISLIRDAVIENAWLSEEEFINLIAVAESTPGPIAINMATFVGSLCKGVLGSLAATLGVVLPSFVIIVIVSALAANFLKLKPVQSMLSFVRPCIVALILSTAVTMGLSVCFGFKSIKSGFDIDLRSILIFAIIAVFALVFSKLCKKKPSPIMLILLSAGLGMIFYSISI